MAPFTDCSELDKKTELIHLNTYFYLKVLTSTLYLYTFIRILMYNFKSAIYIIVLVLTIKNNGR